MQRSLRKFLTVLMALCCHNVFASLIITGSLSDIDGKPAGGVIVRLYDKGKVKAFATSNDKGQYTLRVDSLSFPAHLVFMSKNFAKEETQLNREDLKDGKLTVPDLSLIPESLTLEEVTVRAPHARVKGDTITYDVAAYTNRGDNSIEAVIKKLPGVDVTAGGQIMYQGKPINNFYIEGLNLMGNNYMVATQNINPADVSSISIYERHQSKKALQGISESERAAINLKLKKGSMLKPVGFVEAGAGYGEEALWSGNLYTMLISPNNQTIINAKGNNNNTFSANFKSISGRPDALFPNEPFGKPSISTDRYLENKSGYFTGNTLFKLKEDLTMTVNASYGMESGKFSEDSEILYVDTGNGDILYSENVGNHLRRNDINVAAKIENNTSKLYLMDQVTFDGRFKDNSYDIFTGADRDQRLKSESYQFVNDFSIVIRKDKKAYEVKSKTTFDRTPYISMSSGYIDNPANTITQNVFSQNFHNEESTKLNWKLTKHHQVGGDLLFSMDANRFNTIGRSENEISANELRGVEFKGTVSPYYTFIWPRRIQATLTLPLTYNGRRFTDRITGITRRPDKFYIDIRLFVFLELNRYNKFNISADWKHDTGDIYNYAVAPVYTTFRNSVTLGTGQMNESLNKVANIAYYYTDYLNSLYINAMVMYAQIESNSIAVSNVEGSSTSLGSMNLSSTNKSLYGTFKISKRIRPWNTSADLTGTVLNGRQQTLRNGSIIRSQNTSWSIKGKLETSQFNDLLSGELEVAYRISRQSFSGGIPSSGLDDLSIEGRLSFFPLKQLEIYGYGIYGHHQLSDSSYKNNLFVDAGIKYSIKKFTLEFSARNLTGLKNYEYTVYRALDYYRYSFSLRPREFLLSFNYKF